MITKHADKSQLLCISGHLLVNVIVTVHWVEITVRCNAYDNVRTYDRHNIAYLHVIINMIVIFA